MEKETKKKTVKKVATVLGSVAVGAGLGVLFAPKSGSETRKDLSNKMKSLIEKAKTLQEKDVKKYVLKKVKGIEKELKQLENEKVLKKAEGKIKKIKEDAKDLVEYVANKNKEDLSQMVNDVHVKVNEMTEEVLKKLNK